MDPIATAKRLTDALNDGDKEEAKDAYDDLQEWKNKGGHWPQEASEACQRYRKVAATMEGHWYTR